MGTNYYARIIPSVESKTKLQQAIESNDSKTVIDLVNKMYSRLHLNDNELVGGEVHLGKRSGGWKFLWNPNVYVTREIYKDNDTGEYRLGKYVGKFLYELTRKGIKEFINRDDVVIYNEYNEILDKDKFFDMAINWCYHGWDSKKYYEEHPDDYDGYVCRNDLTKFLDQEFIDYISTTHSDFYNDNDFRFSTSTDFS